ncbi:hypothetical protein HHI36_023030 [Cryptolaemus montrouzieri]|uniref:Uncharacterized protein n=1 Tax=Cryptolaemus montrouzieri TaxID=559131 RepID=A0ABD2PFA8_9CUCU
MAEGTWIKRDLQTLEKSNAAEKTSSSTSNAKVDKRPRSYACTSQNLNEKNLRLRLILSKSRLFQIKLQIEKIILDLSHEWLKDDRVEDIVALLFCAKAGRLKEVRTWKGLKIFCREARRILYSL